MNRTVLLIVNANARNGEAYADEVERTLKERGLSPETVLSTSMDESVDAVKSRGPHCDVIAVGGGDGTLNGLLPHLLELDRPVAVIPLGTANDFASSLELPEDPAGAAGMIVDGEIRRVDVAFANGRPFLNVVNIGLGEKVARLHRGWTKRLLGVASYPLRWFAVWRRSRHLKVRAIPDGGAPELFRASQVSIANSNSFGRHFQIDADNSLQSGELSVARLDPRDLASWLKLLPKLMSGQVARSPDARVSRVRTIRIETEPPAVYSGDGETMGCTPVEIGIRPAALRVFAPRVPGGDRG